MPGAMGTRALSTNGTQYHPIWIGRTVTVDRIAVRSIATATVVGTADGRLGIFEDSNGAPGALKIDAGGFTYTSATGTANHIITISQSLTAGWYWLAFSKSENNATWRGQTAYVENYWMPTMLGDPASDQIVAAMFCNSPSRSGGFPATADAASANGWASAAVYIRV